eukprot:1348150-Amphidinium_carterae.3
MIGVGRRVHRNVPHRQHLLGSLQANEGAVLTFVCIQLALSVHDVRLRHRDPVNTSCTSSIPSRTLVILLDGGTVETVYDCAVQEEVRKKPTSCEAVELRQHQRNIASDCHAIDRPALSGLFGGCLIIIGNVIPLIPSAASAL